MRDVIGPGIVVLGHKECEPDICLSDLKGCVEDPIVSGGNLCSVVLGQ